MMMMMMMMMAMIVVMVMITQPLLRNVPSNVSLIASVFTAERMTNKSGTVYSGERAHTS
jgi:hypothetical protein